MRPKHILHSPETNVPTAVDSKLNIQHPHYRVSKSSLQSTLPILYTVYTDGVPKQPG